MSDELLRATIFHTPRNPFRHEQAMQSFADGALLVRKGRIAACGEYFSIREEFPEARLRDLRGGFLLPGFIDTHVHFPQVRILGGLGHQLLDWLDQVALPEEARMADGDYGAETARRFVRALASHGTTTALAFGSHFIGSTASLFNAGEEAGLRIMTGMVLADRMLREELHQKPADAYRDCTELIRGFHAKGRSLFVVTPRFALSASEAMLEVCQTLLTEHPTLRFQTHINESPPEIETVADLFPWAADYLEVYERFGLTDSRAVLAHNVHPSDAELRRMASTGCSVSHCPCSNAALASGIFPMQRHLKAGVPFALGTDVGGGTGFGMLKEGLQAYSLQRLAADGMVLSPAHLLYLSTRAGAEAVGLSDQIGDFTSGKAADYVYLRPPADSPLEGAVELVASPERKLAAIFTLAGAESIREVNVDGAVVYTQ